MSPRIVSLLLTAVILGGISFAADEPVKITTFETSEGKKFDAANWSSFNASDLKTYVLTTLDGKKMMLLERDVVRRTERLEPLDKLPEEIRISVRKSRASAEAARVEAEAVAKDQRVVAEAKRNERETETASRKAEGDLAAAKNLLATADMAIKNSVVDLAAADARYDASKTELGSLNSAPYTYGRIAYPLDTSARAASLRRSMVQAAEDRAHIELDRKEMDAVVTRTTAAIKPLTDRAADARKVYDTARGETAKAIQAAKDAEKQRAGKAEADLLIGKKQ